MSRAADETPKMTAADADARFAALVAEHRAGRKPRGVRAVAGQSDGGSGALAWALVYCIGVAAGAFFHGKPMVALLVGAPLVFCVRVLMRRSRHPIDAP